MSASDLLHISIIQSHLVWENPEANFKLFNKLIKSITLPTDLIVLPEMFSTGFTMSASTHFDTPEGKTLDWLKKQAKSKNAAITGSVIIQENNNYYNRLFFVKPNGTYSTYDKRHLFSLAGEEKIYSAGDKKLMVKYKGWRICPLICYDLRFPVWSRNTQDYDVLIYVANWPKIRIEAWDSLLKARAIENLSYCVGLNRTGLDGNGYEYAGHSMIFDPLGNILSSFQYQDSFIDTITLSKHKLHKIREKFGFLKDRDVFEIKVN